MSEEAKLIWEALNSENPQKETEKTCRQILRQRIRKVDFNDKELRVIVDDFVERLDFSIEIGMEEELVKPLSKSQNSFSQKLTYGTLGTFGLCTTFFCHPFLRIFGYALTIIFGFGLGRMYTQSIVNESKTVSKMIIHSTVEDILRKIDVIYKRLSDLFQFNQLEGRYQEVLRWLQYQYSYNTDISYRNKLSDLLELFDYELVEYAPTLSNYFEEKQANVPQMVTSLCALRNKKNSQFVLNGIVVFPLEQN